MEHLQAYNKKLLSNILPVHVAEYFMSGDKNNDVSYYDNNHHDCDDDDDDEKNDEVIVPVHVAEYFMSGDENNDLSYDDDDDDKGHSVASMSPSILYLETM